VLDVGIRLYEQTPVQHIKTGAKPLLHTADGTVTADNVLLATNAYTVALGHLRHTIYPLHDTLFESEPLSATQMAALGWKGREGIYTAHESLESYRLTARGTIVGGSKGVRYPYGSALVGDSTRWTVALNEQAFRDRFPELAAAKIAHHWGGWIAMTLSFLPTLGVTGSARNLYYALGYNGHGVAAATAMGAMAADFILGKPNESVDDLKLFVPPLPPEPLRWLLVRGTLGVLNYLDRRIDRQLRDARR
jgi:gamma-glutamylputrescine oxidase